MVNIAKHQAAKEQIFPSDVLAETQTELKAEQILDIQLSGGQKHDYQ